MSKTDTRQEFSHFPTTRVVTEINSHRDKWSSKFQNLSSVNNKIPETK